MTRATSIQFSSALKALAAGSWSRTIWPFLMAKASKRKNEISSLSQWTKLINFTIDLYNFKCSLHYQKWANFLDKRIFLLSKKVPCLIKTRHSESYKKKVNWNLIITKAFLSSYPYNFRWIRNRRSAVCVTTQWKTEELSSCHAVISFMECVFAVNICESQ